jgi:lysophospholipase L1-like esterase
MLRFLAGSLALGGIVLAGCVSQSQSSPVTADQQVAQAGQPGMALAAFQRSLEALRAGRIDRVSVLQIGDSHTAGDHFSGRLRELLQERFGNGGRGMMPPGYPFPYWRPYQVEVSQKGGWNVLSSNNTNYPQVPFGISGFITQSRRAGDSMNLAADSGFDSADIDFFRAPNGGHFSIIVDGRPVEEVDTRGAAWELARKSITTNGEGSLEIRARGDGPVSIADWAVYRRERGVVLSSMGFVGAQIGIMDHWDAGNVARQLREMSPALIILAFGTNEGFDPPSMLGDYESVFASRLAQLHQMMPSASIVVVGPPDANRLPSYCGLRGPQVEKVGCAPLTPTQSANYGELLARRDRSLCHWHTPAGVAMVRADQQQASRAAGAFFWDWSSVQGGECGANNWVPQQLQRADRVHMFESGYGQSAERLFAELMRGYRGR